MKDKLWDIGRRLIVIVSVAVLIVGCVLGTGEAQNADQTPQQVDVSGTLEPVASEANETNASKDEIVYGTLSPTGSVEALYVVNHFVTMPSTPVTDYGDYEQVQNLTNTDPIRVAEDAVTFTPDTDSFYYQGNMKSRALPWDFEVTYSLDGAVTQPADLAGRDGQLAIHIVTKQNDEINSIFFDNYLLQISITLDRELCKNINAPGGTVASAGKNAVIAYTVLPGKDGNITLRTDVHDFEMATGISVSAMPYSMDIELPDMEDSLKDLEQLPEAISSLNDGVGELVSGTRDMRSGADQLVDGSSSIRSGLSLLEDSGSQVRSGAWQIGEALDEIASGLNNSGLEDMDLSAVEALPSSFQQLRDGLSELSDGLTTLQDGYSQAYAALDGAIAGIPEPTLNEEDITAAAMALAQTDPTAIGVITELASNYEAAQVVRGTYEAVQEAFASVDPAITQVNEGLCTIIEQLDGSLSQMQGQLSQLSQLDQLTELSYGINQLASSYWDFADGLDSYIEGVGTLSDNYSEFHSGIRSLASGVDELNAGVGQLHEGTNTLNTEIEDLPQMIQDEIDKMKEEYMPADFEPVSFVSSKNKDTDFVQFVLQMDGIKQPEEETETPSADNENKTFWDRLADVF